MAFKGDLKNISLFDIFQTLNTNNQTGVLVLQREGVTKKVHCSPQGVRVFFTRSFRGLRLGEVFVRRGLLTNQDVEILLLEQKRRYRPIGQLILESGKVPPEEVTKVLRHHAEDEIFEIFSWKSGTFAFYDGQAPEDEPNSPLSEVLLDPSGLCLEAARRLDEMEVVRAVIPDDKQYFLHVDGGSEPDRDGNDEKICAVYDALAVPSCVEDVRDKAGLAQFDILRSLYLLVQGGFIRGLTFEEMIEHARLARDRQNPERAARLFERALSEQPGSLETLEECVAVLRQLDDGKRLAHHLASLGAMRSEEGDHDKALDLLEQALRQDAENFPALTAMRRCLLDRGETERAADISLRIARIYAERGETDEAIQACRAGVEFCPASVAIRFYLGQLLARADQPADAKRELLRIVEETMASRRAMRSEKAHELLTACYKLVQKIDAQDTQAREGLIGLERLRIASARRRKIVLASGIAAALLVVLGGMGVVLGGPTPDALFAQVTAAQKTGDVAAVIAAVDALAAAHPDSEETRRALAIRREVETAKTAADQERRRREDALRQEIQADLETLRAALNDRPYVEAAGFLGPFLGRLAKPEAAFLRKTTVPYVEDTLMRFLDRVLDQFEKDRQKLAACDRQMKARGEKTVEELLGVEQAIGAVRGRTWSSTIPLLISNLEAVRASPYIGSGERAIESFKAKITTAIGSFNAVDDLYFAVRAQRLRLGVDEAIRTARTEGRRALQMCEFGQARELYRQAYDLADAVADEAPRERFVELIAHLERTNVLGESRDRIEMIDHVVRTLAQVETLRGEGDAPAAYRLLRPLVASQHLIQFERRYTMPFRIESTPDGADVSVNGKVVGRTPLDVGLPIVESAQVRLSRKGFEDAEVTLQSLDPRLDGMLRRHLAKRTAWSQELTGQIQARPTLAGELILAAGRNGLLYGLRVADGSVAFSYDTKALDGIRARPLADGENAYVITIAGVLHSIRLKDQAPLPPINLPGQVYEDPCLSGGTIYAVTRDRRLVAIRGGKLLFDRPLDTTPSSGPVVAGGRLLFATAEGDVRVHDEATGEEKARLRPPSRATFLGGIAVHEGLVLAGGEDGSLYAFDPAAGSLRWLYSTGGAVRAPAFGFDQTIFVGSTDGAVHALDLEGNRVALYDLTGPVTSSGATENGFLYAVTGSGNLSSFDVLRKVPFWDFSLGEEAPTGVVAGGGMVVVVTEKSRVVAFNVDDR
ncbi:MAG: outer membrane protein assembly factor BamB family protein [Planctomycetaceae bacterium]